jgi:flagellar biosynthesis protein
MRSRKAVALAYSPGDIAPRVAAAGRGLEAERMLRLAEEAGVPIVADSALADLLEPLDFGALVPEAYWEAVANVLAFVMALEDEK